MKKIAVWLLILALMLSLAACGQKAQNPPAETSAPAGQEETPINDAPVQEETPADNTLDVSDAAVTEAPEDVGDPDADLGDGDTESSNLLEELESSVPSGYVLDAEWCEYEGLNLPELNREYFSAELADQVETEMKDLYAELTADLWDFDAEGGHGPFADFDVYRFSNMVSILLVYDRASFAPEYYEVKCYCIDLDEQRILDVNDVCSRYDFSLEALKQQVKDVRLAYYSYYNKYLYAFEADGSKTIEDCIDEDMQSLDRMLQETPQNVLAMHEDYFSICMTICEPGAETGYQNMLIYLGNDPDYVAYFNAPYGAEFCLLAEPSADYLEMYPPDEEWILDEDEYAETCLFVNNCGEIGYRVELLEAGEDADGNLSLTASQVLAEGSLGFADTMLLKLDRPEGVPKYRLVLIDPESEEGEASTEYVFAYNGRFGTLPIEYLPFDVGVG